MRLTKSNPTGGYSYLSDGVSPASDVLSDGYSAFTPGISEINGAGSRFYLADAQGNSRGLLDAGQGNPDGYNWDAFGNAVSRLGTNPMAFAWNEASGYQSDNDSGLKLLGHRYYDSRTGRFISQDPAGDGSNWYAYCDNDPTDGADPTGLLTAQEANDGTQAYQSGTPGLYDEYQVTNGDYANAKYIKSVLIGFNSSLSPSGLFGGPIMSFPGGSASLMRNLQSATQLAMHTTPPVDRGGRNGILSGMLSALMYADRLNAFKKMVHGNGNKKGKAAGPWDIKENINNPILYVERQNAGDFMYGAGGAAAAVGSTIAQIGAGYAQTQDDSWPHAFSYWQTGGDDPEGHGLVVAGMAWYNAGTPRYSIAVP